MENVQAHAGVITRLSVSQRDVNGCEIGRYNRLVSLGSDRVSIQ